MTRRDFDPSTVQPDGRPAVKATLAAADAPRPWRGFVNGEVLGGPVTVLAYGNDVPGEGPPLHVHPYDELFIIRQGRALFTVGDERFECEAGQIVFGPAGVPHKFTNLGPGRLETTDIHVSDRWIQTDLPDPE